MHWFALSLLILSIPIAGCKTPTPGRPPACPKRSQAVQMEMHQACGEGYEKCPETRMWLYQMVQHCSAVKALQ